MFSSNPAPQFPSSIHVFPPCNSFFDLERDGIHFNHHHYHHHHHHNNNQFVNGDCFFHAYNSLAPPPIIADNLTVRQHYSDANSSLLESVIYPPKKKMGNIKKDGHSKIHTAQGPRDRRVRMSIEVARKFFFLQDLLGFDKASKTLDWLFTKSKTAIKELVEERKHFSSRGPTDQCEDVFQETLERRSDDQDKGDRKLAPKSVDAKNKRKYRSVDDVNHSRVEARARARERTKEKLQNKKLDYESKKVPHDRCGESIMEPKLPMSSSVLYGYQHNALLSNDLSSPVKCSGFLNLH